MFDYDGPFSAADQIGRAEINFLKTRTNELADFWVPLEGRRAKAEGASVHLKVFLTNTLDDDKPKILEWMDKAMGEKVCGRRGVFLRGPRDLGF